MCRCDENLGHKVAPFTDEEVRIQTHVSKRRTQAPDLYFAVSLIVVVVIIIIIIVITVSVLFPP